MSKPTITTRDYELNHGKAPSKRAVAIWAFELTYANGKVEITYVNGRWASIAKDLAATSNIIKVEVLG